ncbi:SDR family NAD(P)-dependent oxidoreductase [Arsenicibacter rosenii]|uniref:Short-chain dehydrogenase n=1 Tax=Arsenicibacter rosenii TaxID=1750698 RepID=A0A1S2VDB6_9BACT|nr:SDR family oxidoreductase [Arsenicibacter rosenii]OIN56216.1 short-chain dehydrogenase [Arsenicibacter rosenii]
MTAISKTALVTGGSRGLGKDMALSLAQKGIDVVLTYHSRQDEAQAVVAAIQALGRKAAALQLNTGEVATFATFAGELTNTLSATFDTSHFDFLINNAGIAGYTPIGQVTEAEFDQLTNVHYKGVFFLTQTLLPIMNDGGRLINISSGLARFSYPGSSVYGSLKGAVEVLTRYMAKELGPRRITANVVAPGPVATDFGGGHVRDNEEYNRQLSSLTALGRVGLPEDIGGVVAFLCSEEARWVNAQRIEVAGGIFI